MIAKRFITAITKSDVSITEIIKKSSVSAPKIIASIKANVYTAPPFFPKRYSLHSLP
jgi:hypothetical protein